MKNFLKKAMDKRGLTPNDVAHMGIPYQTVYKQYNGEREVSPEYAMKYEKASGIPKEEIRPDIWFSKKLIKPRPKRNENATQGI